MQKDDAGCASLRKACRHVQQEKVGLRGLPGPPAVPAVHVITLITHVIPPYFQGRPQGSAASQKPRLASTLCRAQAATKISDAQRNVSHTSENPNLRCNYKCSCRDG